MLVTVYVCSCVWLLLALLSLLVAVEPGTGEQCWPFRAIVAKFPYDYAYSSIFYRETPRCWKGAGTVIL